MLLRVQEAPRGELAFLSSVVGPEVGRWWQDRGLSGALVPHLMRLVPLGAAAVAEWRRRIRSSGQAYADVLVEGPIPQFMRSEEVDPRGLVPEAEHRPVERVHHRHQALPGTLRSYMRCHSSCCRWRSAALASCSPCHVRAASRNALLR